MWMVGSAVQQGKARHVGRNKKMKHMERDGELEKMGGDCQKLKERGNWQNRDCVSTTQKFEAMLT